METKKIKIDARLKILLSIAFSCAVFYVKGWVSLAVFMFASILISAFLKVPIRLFLKKNKYILIVGIVSLVFSYVYDIFWMYVLKKQIFTLGPLVLHSLPSDFWLKSLKKYLIAFAKFVNLIFVSFSILHTTPPNEIAGALESLLKPLEFLRINAKEIAMTSVLSLRFFGILKKEWQKLFLAQKSRCSGAGERRFSLMKILKRYIHISNIFLKICFKKQKKIAQALSSRCWNIEP